MNILTQEQRDWIVATCPTPADIINAAEDAILAKLSEGFVMPEPSHTIFVGQYGNPLDIKHYTADQLRAADAGGYARGFQAGAAAQLAPGRAGLTRHRPTSSGGWQNATGCPATPDGKRPTTRKPA